MRFTFLHILTCSGWFLVKLEPVGRVQSELWRGLEEEKARVYTSFEWGQAL